MNIDSIAIEAATDGACSGNPGPGGWGGLIIFDDKSELEIGGSEQNTTNNRMELTAACLLYTSPSPRDMRRSRMPSSA